jgi:adenylate cyclase
MGRLRGLIVPACLLALLLGMRIVDPGGVLARARLATFDTYQRLAPRAYQPAPVRIVDIDDASLAELGQWPWPRTVLAGLVTRLAQAGAAAIAFDILFAEPDRTSPHNVVGGWTGVSDPAALQALIAALPDHDEVLARAFADAGNVITAFVLTATATAPPPPLARAGFAVAGDPPDRFLPAYAGAIASLAPLQAAAAGNASINFTADQDAVVRRVPTVLKLGETFYPGLAVDVLRVAQGAGSYVLRASGGGGQTAFGEKSGLNAVKIGAFTMPTDAAGQLLLHFTPRMAERTLSARDVLSPGFEGSPMASRVDGALVLVGTSAAGLLDLRATPIDPAMPGVEVHAQAIEQILLDHYLERPDWADGAEVVFLLLVGGVLIGLIGALGAVAAALVGIGAIVAAAAGSWHAYAAFRLLLDPVMPGFALLLVYLTGSLLGYLRTEGERREIRHAFGRYLSPDLVQQIAADPGRLKLGGERRTMTLLFCDVRGFTAISERYKDHPEGLTFLINRLLTPLSEVLLERRATIDKYMGDCIMAFWNAPLDDPDHTAHACAGALAMLDALAGLNVTLAREAEAQGGTFQPLAIGIGINTGDCVVGNMGSRQRFDYSVLGDAVNLASRLEGQSKTYGVDIVIGEAAAARVPDWATLELDLIAVKGKTQAVAIHTVLGPPDRATDPAFQALKARHVDMLRAYRGQDWDGAEAAVEDCAAVAPALAGFYALYRQRIADGRKRPPDPGWTGVYVATSK